MSLDNKSKLAAVHRAFQHPDLATMDDALDMFFTPDAKINVSHPVNDLIGAAGIRDGFIRPLRDAFEGLYLRPDILIGGTSYDGTEWVSDMGYLVGTFRNDWVGIPASGKLAYLRYGSFHRMEDGKAVESYIYLDIPELLMGMGLWPLQAPQGFGGMKPGPASHDGLQLSENDPKRSTQTYKIMTDMLSGLATKDEAWRPYWHPNMMWHGPAAFGSFVGIEEFQKFQVPFEAAFTGWGGGLSPHTPTKHFTRFADGDYSCIGGWPSLQGTHTGTYLGFEPTGVTTLFRVCDWYRLEGETIVENWIFVDIPDALLQWGYDVIAEVGRA